ncbi:hypothetical protein TS65_20400 [Aneurinibacillus migulanus]|uniref:DNA-binding protein n=2 Tax=Aneurinibacillus migulanus TaxID=47500 RepID=A0A1G9CGV9_ANEMI|nr:hypothetical protein TS65_20400 [Aneurinibacillus migulanus]CEH32509.1 Uncharacterized protein BN1089_A1_03331 [Aneurinibacillus migulanus]SDK50816.1 hypothetical protein SAMN04487909_1632 [Aneurinibacillus migulanus]
MSEHKSFFRLFVKNLKKAMGPGQYEAHGIRVICPHCNHNQFDHGYAQLNTSLMTFFNLDFANRSAEILTCDRCGHIQWFNKTVKRIK